MLPDLTSILTAATLSAWLTEILAMHGPSALQRLSDGRLRIPSPAGLAAESPIAPLDRDPLALQLYPEHRLAIQPVTGVLIPGASQSREQWNGWFNTDRIRETCLTVQDMPGITSLLFVMDTPGGLARGLAPASGAILNLRAKRKDMTCAAYVPSLCASAGYYLAASTGSIHAAPSALVGSIGTIASQIGRASCRERVSSPV